MLRMTSEPRETLSRLTDNGWEENSELSAWKRAGGSPIGKVIAGVAVIGLGVLPWAYLGPDLKGYVKIHNM